MDPVNNWKQILFQWIKKCNFLESPFYSIEQSEIEIFFSKFKEYITEDIQKKDLCCFLKENYPSFEPHFDDEDALSSSDYIYVYSLLLHYSCVKYPNEFFQQKCQELDESIQQDIATFFKKVFELKNLSKQSLRHVIATAAMSPVSTIQLLFADSPIKTPRKNEISPPTPRSCMFRERNKELYHLKTQLENEIYEKGILELEVKQSQEKIFKLRQDLKKSHNELENLRNDIISSTSENKLLYKNSEDQMNRKLCRQISQKEQELKQQREDIDVLTEEKNILKDKLDHAEKQLRIDKTKIEELAMQIDELLGELEEKECAIQYLSEVKLELEQHISEIRSSSATSRPDLNVSAECLDLSRTTNSSASINSPENLGCSVVDVQLREKENENIQLRDELSAFRSNYSKLSKQISALTTKYSTFFAAESVVFDQDKSDPFENFLIFSNYLENFVLKYNETSSTLSDLRDYLKNMENEKRTLSTKIAEIENESFDLKKEIKRFVAANEVLKNENVVLEKNIEDWETNFNENDLQKKEKIFELEEENTYLVSELGELKNKLNCLQYENQELQNKNKDIEKKNISIKSSLIEINQRLQKSLEELKFQKHLVSMLHNEKRSLLNTVQVGLDLFKHEIDNIDKSLALKNYTLANENEILLEKLSLVEGKCKSHESQLNDFSDMLIGLKVEMQDVLQKHELLKPSLSEFQPSLSSAPKQSFLASHASDVKVYINTLVEEIQKIYEKKIQDESKIANAIQNMKGVTLQKKYIEEKTVTLKRSNHELCETLEGEKQCNTNNLSNEVHRLNKDIMNIQSVCDNLTKENISLQTKMCEDQEVIDKLTGENKSLLQNNTSLENELSRQLELRTEVLSMHITLKKIECDIEAVDKLLVTKSKEAEIMFEERNKDKNKIESMKKHIKHLESKISALETSLTSMTEKYVSSNKLLEEKTLEQCCKVDNFNEKLQNEIRKNSEIMSEMKQLQKDKIAYENKYQMLEIELGKYKTELEFSKTQLHKLQYEDTILKQKQNDLLTENSIDILKKELSEQKQNVSQLIRELALTREEKDYLRVENNNLQKNLDEKISALTLLSSQHHSSVEKLKLLENELNTKQSLINSEQMKSIDLENKLTKTQMENFKLKETAENNIKRMEKQALKLGETQANVSKFKKEYEHALGNLENLKSSSEFAQRENGRLNFESKVLKEKITKFEKTIDQLESKLQKIEKENDTLRTEKEKLETCANELNLAKTSLEKNNHILEDKIRKLTKSLIDANTALSRFEQEKVSLNLEIGAINTELKESKSLLSLKTKEIQDITEVKKNNLELMALNKKMEVNLSEIQDENVRLNDKLSKLTLRLSIIQNEYDTTKAELETSRSEFLKKKQEAETIEKEHLMTKEILKKIQVTVEEKQAVITESMGKNIYLEEQIEKLLLDIKNLEEARKHDKQTNEKLNTDISILQAKLHKSRLLCEENEKRWKEEKEELSIEVKASEDRIKETRLELEGKLEKMKTKMKTLYNEEIGKMKKKQERETNLMRTELDTLKAQNEKYEENTKKLAGQVFRLNENILEYQKQNTFLQTKLKNIESESHLGNKVINSHKAQSQSNHHVLGPNLHMEDEEGEVFNNTYLSDLKNGKMPEVFGRGISPQELQHRNSLRPPHLKTAYFAQYDHQMGEDEIRDIPNLDDSLSTLLNTGQRKKISGATSYKRPGPPTPSKNAGRLSFGGNGEPSREILRETFDVGSNPPSMKTPAKFKLFSSRHSIKDEYNNCMINNLRRSQISGDIQCSSTPRKSKAHFDQRRILDQLMSTARPVCENSDTYNSSDVHFQSSQNNLEFMKKKTQKYNTKQFKHSRVLAQGEKFELRSHKHRKDKFENDSRFKSRRYSINIKGSMFLRNSRTFKKDFCDFYKNRSAQRSANFSKYRRQILNHFSSNSTDVTNTSIEIDSNESQENNVHTHKSDDVIDVTNEVHKSSINFKKLLIEKASDAPFEISEIFPSMKSNSSSNIDSRTVYGTSVIFNRRIPSVNAMHVRKSSIYVKSGNAKSVILVTNQTITLMDLAQIWMQMNTMAKSVICMGLTTLCITVFIFAFQFVF